MGKSGKGDSLCHQSKKAHPYYRLEVSYSDSCVEKNTEVDLEKVHTDCCDSFPFFLYVNIRSNTKGGYTSLRFHDVAVGISFR